MSSNDHIHGFDKKAYPHTVMLAGLYRALIDHGPALDERGAAYLQEMLEYQTQRIEAAEKFRGTPDFPTDEEIQHAKEEGATVATSPDNPPATGRRSPGPNSASRRK